jgi:hypothetical protein
VREVYAVPAMPSDEPPVPHRREGGTERTMLATGFVIVIVAGGGILLWRYGALSAAVALVVIAGAALLFLVLYFVLRSLEKWANQ